MNNNFVILSGIAPGSKSGTGIFLTQLISGLKNQGIQIVSYHPTESKGSILHLMKKFKIRIVTIELLSRIVWKLYLPILIKKLIKDSRPIIVLHPQSLKWPNLLKLASDRKAVTWLYILDNSFFCARSYNSIIGEYTPCLRCHGNNLNYAKDFMCVEAKSITQARVNAQIFRDLVQSRRIKLFTQNKTQTALVMSHFQKAYSVEVGLDVLGSVSNVVGRKETGYDIVYHGSGSWAKGIGICVEIASRLPHARMLIVIDPRSLEIIAKQTSLGTVPNNIDAIFMHWGTGLKENVETAKIVLCPSVWSSPIEGALLKSLLHNGCVGAVRDSTCYASELPSDALIDINPFNWNETIERLSLLLQNKTDRVKLRSKAQDWALREQRLLCKMSEKIAAALNN